MSKDVRRLFAAQKAAKAASSPTSAGSRSPSLSSSAKRVTHPLAKYDPKTFRLTCAICGPAVNIKSDSLWNAHLVSKTHQEAVAKLRAVKEQMQRKEAEAAQRQRLQQQQQQQQTQSQGVKRKATGGLVAYADESESESDDDDTIATKQSPVAPDSKRVKVDNEDTTPDQEQEAQEIEDEEDTMSGLPAGFFDSPADATPGDNRTASSDASAETHSAAENEDQTETMDGVLPSGFFDDPEEDARIRTEVGGATADLQQRQIDEEFKALQADLAQDLERQEQQEVALRSGQVLESTGSSAVVNGTRTDNDHIPYEEKVEQEELELEESILARSEEEYQLFVEMHERLEALKEKKTRLATHQPSASTIAKPKSKPAKQKNKSILDLVREQELARKEKERLAAQAFAKMNAADKGDSAMASGDEESDEDDEDLEAMMDWRARRV
ncbi:hypothetical protein BG011_007941 [Mortierella polycephala]|uniref:Coiled-coil domain-containing protein 16 n=1 Tax=Mortierella polycephala TaxID=41804 RepID=A0A9P6Q9V6_9FUNG|nr:hypothetical protein BG011_007941 [Mortierella polycephala]